MVVRRRLCLVHRKEVQERLSERWISHLRARKRRRQGFRPASKQRTTKRTARKALILNLDFQPLKHPMQKDMATHGNRTTSLPAIALTSPGLQLLGDLYEGSYCMDGGGLSEPCQPSNSCSSRSWLHTVDWIKSGNRKC